LICPAFQEKAFYNLHLFNTNSQTDISLSKKIHKKHKEIKDMIKNFVDTFDIELIYLQDTPFSENLD